MNDRELLELAALAAGIRLEWDGHPDEWVPMFYEGKTYHAWEPLDDDGEALRLLVKLGLSLGTDIGVIGVTTVFNSNMAVSILEEHKGDAQGATRRAIVRSAAEIGKEFSRLA